MTVSLLQRQSKECPWIVGEPRDMICCGEPTKGVYCEEHQRLSRQPKHHHEDKTEAEHA